MHDSKSPQRILLVDDEPAIRDVLGVYLRDDGFAVSEAGDGVAALQRAILERPALVVLDLTLPLLSGFEVFRRLRAFSDVPVIMLTARALEVDCVVGLELGADDYIGKPFSPREVVARVKSVLRRCLPGAKRGTAEFNSQKIGDMEIDRLAHEVYVLGRRIAVTPMEFRILNVLAESAGRAFSRNQLLDRVSANSSEVFDRTLDRHIANLRRKIEDDPTRPRYIVTVPGIGYKMAPS